MVTRNIFSFYIVKNDDRHAAVADIPGLGADGRAAGNNRVHYTTTIGLDKVTTIAIYENETTFVDDHYSTISQQNL
ncbi:MAG: hypothetical protein Q6365_006500, partial [Candidatus Sigynarchaeota archaeon]